MKRIKILTPFSLGGGRDVFPGDLVEVSDQMADLHVRRGWAEHAPAQADEGEPAGHPEQGSDQVVDRDPEASDREPRRGRRARTS